MSEVFRTVLSMSIGASVLGIMVLAARAVIGSRQTAALTLMLALLVARLVLPVNIESSASVMNLLPDRLPQAQTEVQMDFSGAEDIGYVPGQVQQETDSLDLETENAEAGEAETVLPVADTSAESQSIVAAAEETQPKSIDFWELAAYLWVAGMAALALVIFVSNAVFMRKVRRNREYDLPGLDELISQCAEEFNIKKKIRAVRMTEINNVAVCGIIRPKLLISPETFEELSTQQKKDVIMHEMSHIKRRDTLVSLVMTIVNIVHWFNPVVWTVFTLFRKDMEVMCDSKVLCKMEAWQRKRYADTLLMLAMKVNRKHPRLAMALFMSRTSIKRRITMVARYKKNKPVIVALAMILVVSIAVTGCTTGTTDEVTEEEKLQDAANQQAEEQQDTEESEDQNSVDVQQDTEDKETAEFEDTSGELASRNLAILSDAQIQYTDGETESSKEFYRVLSMIESIEILPGETVSLRELVGYEGKGDAETAAKEVSEMNDMKTYGCSPSTVATAIYIAAVKAQMEVAEVTHNISVPYGLPAGLDVVFSETGGDLEITNLYDFDIIIETKTMGGYVNCEVLIPRGGAGAVYSVELTVDIISNDLPDPIYHYNKTTLPNGEAIPEGDAVTYIESTSITQAVVWCDRYSDSKEPALYETVNYKPISAEIYVNGDSYKE